MDQNNCFICAESCENSYFYLINLASKKFKTKYTSLIGDLINSEYELRVTSENKICDKCSVLIEKFDELQHETKTVKTVLSRQIAHTYDIETTEEIIYMDKSKTFVELGAIQGPVKYSCKICPRFITDSIDTVNSHIIYHKIISESQRHLNDQLRDLKDPKKNSAIPRETLKNPEPQKPAINRLNTQQQQRHVAQAQKIEETKKNLEAELSQLNNSQEEEISAISLHQEYDEESLDSLIDLNILLDPLYDSNLKNHQCMVTSCHSNFTYVNDYIRHLKLRHKSTLNHIFAVVRANIKRPSVVSKLMCPFCFSKMPSSNELATHVKMHEEAAKSNLFTDRINEFVNSLTSTCRCLTCDGLITDGTLLECTHETAKEICPQINCLYCNAVFYDDKMYNTHQAIEHDSCFVCGTACEDKAMLHDHIRSHLSHTEYSCAFCNNIYQAKADRLEHLQKDHSDNCCTYCSEWFQDVEELDHHIRYGHADKKSEDEKPTICDTCGASFKTKKLFVSHQESEHQKRKIYTCSACRQTFHYRYLLMEHISSVHNRTIVDNEPSFYKCYVCNKGFSSQKRKMFVQHLTYSHQVATSFCNDCRVNLESVHHLEAHRERSHQDFSILVDKKITKPQAPKTASRDFKDVPKNSIAPIKRQPSRLQAKVHQKLEAYQEPAAYPPNDDTQFNVLEEDQEQQIMVQTEDGSLLNMNNFILTENGELILQNLDGLLPNGEAVSDDTSGQIHIGNLEQFLIEQGLSSGTEISYIQQEDGGQVIIQNDDGTVSQSSQESLMQTYKQIFEPDEDISAELIESSEVIDDNTSENMLMNGDYMVQSIPVIDNSNNGQIIENIEIQNITQVDANQSTLDELGDILLEVAAAAEKEKKPKIVEHKLVRDSLWGSKKRPAESFTSNGSAKKRNTRPSPYQDSSFKESEQPASNFSQAYEFFVRGFDAKKQNKM